MTYRETSGITTFYIKFGRAVLSFLQHTKGAVAAKQFRWTPECQEAFEELKIYLTSPPLLTTAAASEPLSIYLSATNTAVGAVLIKEDKQGQHPVYYVSQVL